MTLRGLRPSHLAEHPRGVASHQPEDEPSARGTDQSSPVISTPDMTTTPPVAADRPILRRIAVLVVLALAGVATLNLGVLREEAGAVPITYGKVLPGAVTTVVTPVEEMTCQGRSTCTLFAPVFAIAPDAGPAVRVEWTLTAIWFPADGAAVPDGLALGSRVSLVSPSP